MTEFLFWIFLKMGCWSFVRCIVFPSLAKLFPPLVPLMKAAVVWHNFHSYLVDSLFCFFDQDLNFPPGEGPALPPELDQQVDAAARQLAYLHATKLVIQTRVEHLGRKHGWAVTPERAIDATAYVVNDLELERAPELLPALFRALTTNQKGLADASIRFYFTEIQPE